MRKLFIILPAVLLVIASFWSSCTKDDLVTLQGICDTCQAVCDTAFQISYANDIEPIINENCYECHNRFSAAALGEGNILEGYNNLLVYAQDGRLLGTINHADGYPEMPQDNDKLSDCIILRIDRWVQNGAPNN